MIKEKRKRQKRRKRILIILLSLLMILGVGAFLVIKVFTIQKVIVTGNKFYSDESIEEWMLNDEYSFNTLYVYFKYRFQEAEELPFVENMEIAMKGPHTIEIKVYEKVMLGYVDLSGIGQNAYFDKDGFVVETSSEMLDEIPKITGLNVEQVVLYQKLPIKGKNMLENLLSLTKILKKYELVPEQIIYEEDDSYVLDYGNIKVMLGKIENLNEKINRLSSIMPELKKKKGILHLENWTESTTDITFEKKE